MEISFYNGKIILEKYISSNGYKIETERLKKFIENDKNLNEKKDYICAKNT